MHRFRGIRDSAGISAFVFRAQQRQHLGSLVPSRRLCEHLDESKPTRVRYRVMPQSLTVMKVWLRLFRRLSKLGTD